MYIKKTGKQFKKNKPNAANCIKFKKQKKIKA